MPSRVIDCEDAATWLPDHRDLGPVVATLPDADELDMDVADWAPWYKDMASACVGAALGVVVFTATDRRGPGRWIDKACLLCSISPCPLLWHKISLRRDPDTTELHRPGYSHVLAFATDEATRPGRTFPDVWPPGKRLWNNGMAVNVTTDVVRWLDEVVPDGPVVTPFAGHGTVAIAANDQGRDAIGCELDPTRAAIASGEGMLV